MGGRASAQTNGWQEAGIRDGPVVFRKTPRRTELGTQGRAAGKLSTVPRRFNLCAKRVGRAVLT